MPYKNLYDTAERAVNLLKAQGFKLAVAESCTGGMLASAITAIPGASDIFNGGFITYSNKAKTDMINVPAELIMEHGAVSGEVVAAMARGAVKATSSDIAVSITGIAGPSGGSENKPVGLVYISIVDSSEICEVLKFTFSGDREVIRTQACLQALHELIKFCTPL